MKQRIRVYVPIQRDEYHMLRARQPEKLQENIKKILAEKLAEEMVNLFSQNGLKYKSYYDPLTDEMMFEFRVDVMEVED